MILCLRNVFSSDLERTIEKMKILELDNRKLRDENKELESSLRESEVNYDFAKKNYLVTLNKKINQEEQFEGFISKVKQVI